MTPETDPAPVETPLITRLRAVAKWLHLSGEDEECDLVREAIDALTVGAASLPQALPVHAVSTGAEMSNSTICNICGVDFSQHGPKCFAPRAPEMTLTDPLVEQARALAWRQSYTHARMPDDFPRLPAERKTVNDLLAALRDVQRATREQCAQIADGWANSISCNSHENNPCCHVRTGAGIANAIRESQ